MRVITLAIAFALLVGTFSPVAAADLLGNQPEMVPVKPIRITVYRQLTGNGWSTTPNSNTTYNNYNAGISASASPAANQAHVTNAGQTVQQTSGNLAQGVQGQFTQTGQTLPGTTGGWTNQPNSNNPAVASTQTVNTHTPGSSATSNPAVSVRPPQLQLTTPQLTQTNTSTGFPAPPLSGSNTQTGTLIQSGGLNDPGQSPFRQTEERSVLSFPSSQSNHAQQSSTVQGTNAGQNPRRYNDLIDVTPVEGHVFRTNTPVASNQNNGGASVSVLSSTPASNASAGNAASSPWYHGGGQATITGQVPNRQTGGFTGQSVGSVGSASAGISNVGTGPQQTPLPESKWLPLMMSGVALMGSLGANLFLGFGYLDARHKYLSTIRRGSRSVARVDESRAA